MIPALGVVPKGHLFIRASLESGDVEATSAKEVGRAEACWRAASRGLPLWSRPTATSVGGRASPPRRREAARPHRSSRPPPDRHSRDPWYPARRYSLGWEYVHVCVDAMRLAYAEVLPDERETAAGFLERAVAWYGKHAVAVERVMTDDGAGYCSHVHASACRRLGLRHLTTRPYRPRANGKAERFIRTPQRVGSARIYRDSNDAEVAPFSLTPWGYAWWQRSLRPPGWCSRTR